MRTTSAGKDTKDTGDWFVEHDADVWQAFAAPASNEEFCQAWLGLLCRQLTGVKAGVVLLQAADGNTFAPIAVWPELQRDLSFLGAVAERALSEGRGVVHRPATPEPALHVAYPIKTSQRTLGSVVLDIAPRPESEVHALLRQLHWGIAWLQDLSQRHELAHAETRADRVGSIMEIVASALGKPRLRHALFDVANQIARHLRCSRVAIGQAKHERVRLTTLSNTAWFEHNSSIARLYVAAMEEVHDRRAAVEYAAVSAGNTPPATEEVSPHARLARESGARGILSVPLLLGADCVGVVILERGNDNSFSENDRAWVEALAGMLAAVVDQKQRAELGYLEHVQVDLRVIAARLFGPKHLVWKFSATLSVIVLAALLLVHVDYRVSAKTVVEGEMQRAAVAPFQGFLAATYVRAGDVVHRGQTLCALDDAELQLERQKWASEKEQAGGKLREAMAKHDLASYQILNAQMHQAEAQLALAQDRIARANVTAPFDGVVVTGDLSQLVGSPVEQGKKLFEIAPLRSYRVILQVDERDVREVRAGQAGKLVIAAAADDPIAFSVSKVTPVATAADGRNYFRIEANLEKAPPLLRPGMEGVGKITVGERRLWWVLTHSFSDWLRLTFWTWTP